MKLLKPQPACTLDRHFIAVQKAATRTAMATESDKAAVWNCALGELAEACNKISEELGSKKRIRIYWED